MNQSALPYPVKQTLEVGGVRIVLLAVPVKEVLNENIYGLDSAGDVQWQVDQVPRTIENAPFVFMAEDNGFVRANSWDGVVVWIEPITGRVLDRTWQK